MPADCVYCWKLDEWPLRTERQKRLCRSICGCYVCDPCHDRWIGTNAHKTEDPGVHEIVPT